MSAHAEHTSLPGYDPAQLLHDGCVECEYRAQDVHVALGHLDTVSFDRAWERAAELQLHGLRNGSHAELPVLQALAAVQVQLERRGLSIGEMPQAVTT